MNCLSKHLNVPSLDACLHVIAQLLLPKRVAWTLAPLRSVPDLYNAAAATTAAALHYLPLRGAFFNSEWDHEHHSAAKHGVGHQ